MEARKNPYLELDKYRGIFFQIGLILSISLVYLTMEWRFPNALSIIKFDDKGWEKSAYVPVEDIPNTYQNPPPPPKSMLEQPEIVEVQNDEAIQYDAEVSLDVSINDENVEYSYEGGGEGSTSNFKPGPLTAPLPEALEEEVSNEVFLIVEESPTPIGGYAAFYEFVRENLEYPRAARKMSVEGRVFLQFIIGKDGQVFDVKVVKGIGYGCDEEAIRVLKEAPSWNPGKQRGKAVKVKMNIPIIFKLKKIF